MAKKILTVDDSRTIRMIVARALAPFGCQICEASNGEEGLAMAARERPDLVILDVTMPVMDGVTMLKRLKEDAGLRSIPVLMLTAESSRESVLQIARIGIRDYLAKPFRSDQLIERIGRILPMEKTSAPQDGAAPAEASA